VESFPQRDRTRALQPRPSVTVRCSLPEPIKTIHSPARTLRTPASFNWWATERLLFLIAIGVFLLLLATTSERVDSGFVFRTLLVTFVYTFCTGTMTLYVIARLIEPAKFRSEVVAWSLVILCSLGMAVIGAAIAESLLQLTGLFPRQTFSARFIGGLKISLVVTLVAAVGTYAYNRMRDRFRTQNIELQKTIETGLVRVRQQEEDVQTAREIQEGLLPKRIAQVRGYQVTGAWQPALSVGGDYYDVLPFGDSSLGIVIADVVGKGISAALLMANLQAAVRAFAADGRDPMEVCARINGVMCSNVATGKFITLFYCVLDIAKRKLVYSNAGHNPPILLRGDDAFRLHEGGALLGVFRDWEYEQHSIQLQVGDRLLLFTDGLSEAEDPAGVEFGEDRLIEIFRRFRNLPATDIQNRILDTVRDFCHGNFRDDATLLVVAVG
jgi:sigma-B regulation protein RsbU (phosphoserine phosphatase)